MPQESDFLLEIAITAMASAWTPDEIEEILAAAERRELDELPVDLRHRWAEHLDGISIQRFGKTFGDLLAVAPADIDVPLGSPASGATLIPPTSDELLKENLHVPKAQ